MLIASPQADELLERRSEPVHCLLDHGIAVVSRGGRALVVCQLARRGEVVSWRGRGLPRPVAQRAGREQRNLSSLRLHAAQDLVGLVQERANGSGSARAAGLLIDR